MDELYLQSSEGGVNLEYYTENDEWSLNAVDIERHFNIYPGWDIQGEIDYYILYNGYFLGALGTAWLSNVIL